VLSAIRTFTHDNIVYRHAIDFNDHVYLQKFVGIKENKIIWESLVKYSRHLDAWDLVGTRYLGKFRCSIQTKQWTFVWNPVVVYPRPVGNAELTTVCVSAPYPESLLDSEVIISQRWLDQQLQRKVSGEVQSFSSKENPIDVYDPKCCITAQELRSMGLPISQTIPDCAWIRGSYKAAEASSPDFDPDAAPADILYIDISIDFQKVFPSRWVVNGEFIYAKE